MSLSRQIATNTLWMVAGKAITTILSLILTAALARSLGVFGYGEFTTTFAFLVFFGVIADFGFYQILVRELARQPDSQETIANNILTMRALFAFVVYGAAALLVWLFPYSDAVKLGVVILAGASFFLSVNGTIIGIFQANQIMVRAVASDVIGRVFLLVTVLIALANSWSLPAILTLYATANLVNLVLNYIFVRPILRLGFRYQPKTWRMIFHETWSMGLVTTLIILYFRIDTVILSLIKSPIDVGIYGVPYKILEILVLVPGILTGNILPALTKLLAENDRRFQQLIQLGFDILAILAIGVVTGLVLISRSAIELVAGGEFLRASTIAIGSRPVTAVTLLTLLALALLPIFFSYLSSTVLIASGHQRALIKPALAALIINIGLNLLFIPQWSYLAAALATIITETFVALYSWQLARQFVPIELSFARISKALLAALLMTVIIWPLRERSLAYPIIVGAAVYAGTLLILKTFPPQTWQWLRGRAG